MDSKLTVFLRAGTTSFSNLLLQTYKNLQLTDEQMMLIIHILAFQNEGKGFPTIAELEGRMAADKEKIASMLQFLVKNLYLEIEERHEENGVRSEVYNLNPLYKRISRLMEDEARDQTTQDHREKRDQLYTVFENEFGRPLSPIECEMLTMWTEEDRYQEELIKTALKEAVISGKINFKYIDRILHEWQKNQIKTAREAKEYALRFRKYQRNHKKNKQVSGEDESHPPFPFYNWLEEENR